MVGSKVALSDDCCCPGGGCPEVMCPRTVAVSGIIMDCGCIPLSLIGSSGSVEFTSFSNAGSPYTATGDGLCIASPSVHCHAAQWSSDDCSGIPDAEADSSQVLVVSCFNDQIEVMIFGSDVTSALLVSFYNDNVTLGVPASNMASCESVFSTSFGTALGIARSGSVTVT